MISIQSVGYKKIYSFCYYSFNFVGINRITSQAKKMEGRTEYDVNVPTDIETEELLTRTVFFLGNCFTHTHASAHNTPRNESYTRIYCLLIYRKQKEISCDFFPFVFGFISCVVRGSGSNNISSLYDIYHLTHSVRSATL